MRPPWSIVLFTTLAGLGAGLFLGLLGIEAFGAPTWHPGQLAGASGLAFALLAAGLVASVFHLGRPERAWRAASQWRTSWLSREVLALPALMAVVALHGGALEAIGRFGPTPARVLAVGLTSAAGVVLAALLWWCTGMIYACLRMVEDWATPLTPLCFAAIGLAHGLALTAAWDAWSLADTHALGGAVREIRLDPVQAADAQATVTGLAIAALVALAIAVALKAAWWWRRRVSTPKSSLRSALAIDRQHIRQMSMGMTGGSYNTREFFHGRSPATMRAVPVAMVVFGAVLPALALVAAMTVFQAQARPLAAALWSAAVLQALGIVCERWLFFAWARHPQNLYYQGVA